MKLRGSAWPLGLALVWNWSLQSTISVWYWSMILIWYWSEIDLVSIWYWSGIGMVLILVLVWYWSRYWSDIGWILKNGSILRIEKNSFYHWKKSSSILLIRIDQDWFFSMPDPHGTSQYNFVLFETLFRAKGLRATLENRNLTSVFDDRASFRAKTFLRRTLLKIEIFLIFWRSNLPNRSG